SGQPGAELRADGTLGHRQHRHDVLLRRRHHLETCEQLAWVTLVQEQQLHSTSARNRCVRSSLGEEKNWSGGASSTMRPSSIISTEVATWWANRISCVTTTMVIPSR